jgi:putative membrane protein
LKAKLSLVKFWHQRVKEESLMTENRKAAPSDYLAAERTFLAWIRTGLALMGFGFVVARFGLFLRELAQTTSMRKFESNGVSLVIGTVLMLTGAAVNVVATIGHVRLIARLNRGETISRPSGTAIAVALGLSALGLALAAYLIWVG